jgi:queuine/archaeosine tRNA-ribosyltransferase
LTAIRHIHDEWGVRVIFDSGGFFVQQEKIDYSELYVELMDFYRCNDWAEVYVLPDYVPTSKLSAAEVWERVHVTAREGVRFFERLPAKQQAIALGVLQGHEPDQLEWCFNAYVEAGLTHIGFGSFDTKGSNEEINLVTEQARRRLRKVETLLRSTVSKDRSQPIPALHLFGVGAPPLISEFATYGATSFDSSGWQRTAGFGNVYLPFTSRRNVTHGGSSVSLGVGLDSVSFYRMAEQARHSCPFCTDFGKLQENRFFRMWHNAVVYQEMVSTLNQQSNPQEHA